METFTEPKTIVYPAPRLASGGLRVSSPGASTAKVNSTKSGEL
jgi:hypothetical protein